MTVAQIKSPVLRFIYRYGLILIGSFIYAIAISLFLDPNKLAPGGVSGLAIIINHYTSFSTGLVTFLINIPLMILGIWKFGLKFFISTIIATTLGSVCIDVLAPIGAVADDRILCAVIGGALIGISLGFIFKAGATTGGTDIVARLLKLRFPHVETGNLFMAVDSVVVAISAIAFKDIEVALYAAICVFLTGKMFDLVLYGAQEAKLLIIISDKEDEIANKLLNDLDTGVTYLKGIGGYTEAKKKIIMCAMKKQMLPKAQDMIKEVDLNAFIMVTSASEIVGEGYRSPLDERI